MVLVKRSSSPTEAGFSLIEVLIAAGLLLFIAVGIVPLFTRAMVNTISGAESTTVSNFGKTRIEELMALPMDDTALAIPPGASELVVEEYWSIATETWLPGADPPPGDPGLWTRKITVRAFNISDIDDGKLEASEAQPGGNLDQQHLKEITIEIESTREGGPLAEGRELTLTMYKAI